MPVPNTGEAQPSAPEDEIYTVTEDYPSHSADELTLSKGEKVNIMERNADGNGYPSRYLTK